MLSLFITFIYQPFLNILVLFYWLLGLVTGGNPDMGIAVILLTILIRLILLPLSISSSRSEEERRAIASQVREIEEQFSADPVRAEKEKKKILNSNKRVLISELFNLSIQVAIALMLWKIFDSGLSGGDLHLIYPFMPEIEQPFNLVFLGRFDLTHTSFFLNLLQSFLIFILETISLLNSPYKVHRSEVVRLQLVLPVVSFIIFMGLPAGKKLFVITSLIFSILFTIAKVIRRKFLNYKQKWEAKNSTPEEETVVVETK